MKGMETKYVILFTRRSAESLDAVVEPVLYGTAESLETALAEKVKAALEAERKAAAKLDPEWAESLKEEDLKDCGWSWDGRTYVSFEPRASVPGQDPEPTLTWKAVSVSESGPAAKSGNAV